VPAYKALVIDKQIGFPSTRRVLLQIKYTKFIFGPPGLCLDTWGSSRRSGPMGWGRVYPFPFPTQYTLDAYGVLSRRLCRHVLGPFPLQHTATLTIWVNVVMAPIYNYYSRRF